MIRNVVTMLLRPDGETGVQTHVRVVVDARRRRGVRTELITPFSGPKFITYPAFAVRRVIAPISSTASVWWYRVVHAAFVQLALWRALRDGCPTVVYAQCPVSAAAALRARRNAGQAVVLGVHFNISQADEWADKGDIRRNGRYFRRIRRFEERVIPRLDGVLCVSQFSFDQLALRVPTIATMPHTIIRNFVADPRPPAVLAADGPSRGLISIGSVEPRKNYRYALQIVAASNAVEGQDEPLQLTIVGDGPQRDELQALAGDLGIADQIHFAGFVANAGDMISDFDGYMHTAMMENFPMVIVEAMSRGVPVFAAPVGGIGEAFSDGIEGRYLPLDDAPAAATLLAGALSDRGRLAAMAAAARATFLQQYEADGVAARLDDFLTSVATDHP